MTIYIIKKGDSISSVAKQFNISEQFLRNINGINSYHEDKLIEGNSLLILQGKVIHTVEEGDTLASIADQYNVSLLEIIRNNPWLMDQEYIYPKEEIIISYEGQKGREVIVNGYTFTHIDCNTLAKTLVYLTYITIYCYYINSDGSLVDINDSPIIDLALEYGVAPIMLVTTLTPEGDYDLELTHNLLASKKLQETFIENILAKLEEKGYIELTLDLPYVHQNDRELFVEFIQHITSRLNKENYKVNITLSPSAFEISSGFYYRGFDYESIGKNANRVILLTYEWGYTYGPSVALLPYDVFTELLDYTVGKIPEDKITFGMSILNYIWELPYIDGETKAGAISYKSALEVAHMADDTKIQYDEFAHSGFFQFIEQNEEYIVRFKGVRYIASRLDLLNKYGFNGVAIWNVMFFFIQMYLIINYKFEIKRVLESKLDSPSKEEL